MTDSERTGSGSGGREEVTKTELKLLYEKILQDFEEFSANTPFNEENITDYDVHFIMEYEEMADKFTEGNLDIADLELNTVDDYKDPEKFHKLKGRIKGAFIEQIRTDYPKNLEFETYKDVMLDVNTTLSDSISEMTKSPEFLDKIMKMDESRIKSVLGKNNDEAMGEINEALGEMVKKIEDQQKEISELKARMQSPGQTPMESLPKTAVPQPSKPVAEEHIDEGNPNVDYEMRPIKMTVTRAWGVAANEVSGEMEISEMRENETGGKITVGITDGEGSYSWDVTCTKEGHVELYDRTKGLFMQFLRKGVVESDVMYSWPKDPKSRVFSPDFSKFGIECHDSWPDNMPMFMRTYFKELTFTVGKSRWSVSVEIDRKSVTSKGLGFRDAVRDFRFSLKELMEMILLSGEEIRKDVQSIK